MKAPLNTGRPRGERGAFTLLEVMIASGILFMCLFAILAVLATGLRNARSLKHVPVDAGMLAAELSLTNKFYEGVDSGRFENTDYEWEVRKEEVESNHLYRASFRIWRRGDPRTESHMSVLYWMPDSPAGTMDGGGMR
jgi:Tfp pilus assembly protein PilV